MKARYLGLFGVGLLASAAWGCLKASGDPTVGPEGNRHRVGEVRSDVPGSGTDLESTAAGVGGSNTFTTTATISPGAGGGAMVGPDNTCGYPYLGEVHLGLPSTRALASPALARGFIDAGRGPDPAIVRPRDFLNYYQVRYPQTSPELTVVAEVTAGDDPHEAILQVGLQAPASGKHRALALVVVVDTSLSMAGESMKRARKAVEALAQALEPGDSFTLVTSALAGASLPILINDASDVAEAAAMAQSLEADGGDLLGAALSEAYLVAEESKPAKTKQARVVLITDGAARSDEVDLGVVAGNQKLRHIPLIGVGVGSATAYESELVDVATRIGGGASVFLDSAAEAQPVLRDRFDQLMDVWADEVELVIRLPEGMRAKNVQTEVPTDSPTGALKTTLPLGRTIVFRQVLESCKSMTVLANRTIDVHARWIPPGGDAFQSSPEVGGTLTKLGYGAPASAQVQKAALIAAYADALAGLRTAQLESIAKQIAGLASDPTAPPGLATDPDLTQIALLSQKLLTAAKP